MASISRFGSGGHLSGEVDGEDDGRLIKLPAQAGPWMPGMCDDDGI